MIKRKCIEAKPKTNFNEYKDDINRADSIFEKAWKDKTPLREISKVEISKEVLDWFLNLEETFVISDEEQVRHLWCRRSADRLCIQQSVPH